MPPPRPPDRELYRRAATTNIGTATKTRFVRTRSVIGAFAQQDGLGPGVEGVQDGQQVGNPTMLDTGLNCSHEEITTCPNHRLHLIELVEPPDDRR